MKWLFFFLFLFALSCNQKKACVFTTVNDLDDADFNRCPPSPKGDSTFIWMRHFSGWYNNTRKEKGIPVLPADYVVEVFTVNNQVRWHGDVDRNGNFFTIGQPYMKWKTLEWNKDTLKYDNSLFVDGEPKDRWGKTLNIVYYFDSAYSKSYKFRCEYSMGQDAADITINKEQADSILTAWKIKP